MLRTVTALALPGVTPFELGIACEVFGIDRRDSGGPAFDFTVCAPDRGTVRTSIGLGLVVEHGLERTTTADLVVVPALESTAELAPAALDALRAAHARGARILSLCSGAFVLGAAGLLDDLRCTTHWMHADRLARLYPTARVDPDVLYVDDRRIVTSAGTAAGIDACLHLVRCELGASMAAAIARRMVVPPHRDGGQAQYIATPIASQADTLAPVLDWMLDHLGESLPVRDLAARALLSERTFARRFRDETGTTPAAWLRQQRLSRARELLEGTEAGIDEIAESTGFGTAAVMRHHFGQSLGTSPRAYRRTFAGRTGAAEQARKS